MRKSIHSLEKCRKVNYLNASICKGYRVLYKEIVEKNKKVLAIHFKP